MGGILDKLDEWLRGLLVEGITGNLSGMFDTVNTKVGEIAGEVGQTPPGGGRGPPPLLVKKVSLDFFDKLLSELQNQFL